MTMTELEQLMPQVDVRVNQLARTPFWNEELNDPDQYADTSFEIECVALSQIAQIDINTAYSLLCQYYENETL